MLRRILLFTLLTVLFLPYFSSAQTPKKLLSQARDYIKSGTDLDKAETILRNQLNDSTQRQNIKTWKLLSDCIKEQYEQANEQLYLKQQYDTAAFFGLTMKLFATMEAMDSVDETANKPGQPKYRQHNAEYLSAIRPNLFYGGVYLVQKHEYAKAYDYFEHYIALDSLPLFSSERTNATDQRKASAAYWTMYCGYKLKSDSLILRYHSIAEYDTAQLAFVLQYEAEAYKLRHDNSNYVKVLEEGFNKYPKFPFFFPNLMEYYDKTGQTDKALTLANRAMEIDSTSEFYRYAKSSALLNIGKYDECIELSKQLIAENENLAGAYYNAGLAYFDKAIELDKNRQTSSSTRRKTLEYYKSALPYLEKYRTMAPDRKDDWLSPLYTIYLNLNMGKQFDEIDKLRNEYRRNHK